MKQFSGILGMTLLAIGLLFTACKKEEVVDPQLEIINYDGANVNAPNLPAGNYRGAAKFIASEHVDLQGGQLELVDYYIIEKPSSLWLRVYKSVGTGTPEVAYEANILNETSASSWNVHTLPTPVDFDDKDMWISIEFEHITAARVLGCDPGPAIGNGEAFYDATVGVWTTLSNAFSNIDINWNIRGQVRKP